VRVAVRVRFAPSPTGALHPGSARTVLFNYLFARHHGGQFILRIEDTDRARTVEGSLESILGGMRWLGLGWDEGPEVGGPHAPYFQSQRLERYREAAEQLLEQRDAYPCFCTPARLEALRESQRAAGVPTRYDRHCLGLPPAEVAARLGAGEPHTVRMKVPEGTTELHDLIRALEPIDNRSQDDQVLLKSDGYPTYHLAATVDDHLMEISHVIRADEWLGSFAKHLILYRMLGWEPPQFAHLPLVLGPDRAKLSKRHGSVALLDYRDGGYLAEAMVNFLALLGWSDPDGREFLRLEDLVGAFDLARVQPSPAVFDLARLDSLNGQHLRALEPAAFEARLGEALPELPPTLLRAAAPLVQERMTRLTEARDLLMFLVDAPATYPDELVPKRQDAAATALMLERALQLFSGADPGPALEAPLRALAEEHGWAARDLFMTLRVALTGRTVTPPLLESAAILGRNECLRRLETAAAAARSRA